MPLPLKLGHVNLWVLEDVDGLMLVDTGIADELTPRYLRQAQGALPKKPITRVLATHHHPDHCGLVDRICEEHRAELLISTQAYEAALALQHHSHGTDTPSTATSLARHGLSVQAQRYLVDNADELDALKPGMPPVYTPLSDGEALHVGEREWRVMFGHGHAPDHVSLYAPGQGHGGAGSILVSGDMLLPRISTHVGSPAAWLQGNPVAQFLDSVGRLATLPADTLVLPSHGSPFYGARERVTELARHHEQRCLLMLKVLGEPRSAGELLAEIFHRELDPLQLMLAMHEAIARLEYMTERDDLDRIEGDNGITRYVRKASSEVGDRG